MTTTLVDSNVVIDVLDPTSSWMEWASRKLTEARLEGQLVFNIVIAAEIAYAFVSKDQYDAVFPSDIWTFEAVPFEAGRIAGWAHRQYRMRGGPRERTLPDFLIGAHAEIAGHRLLTRDAGRYRTYFPALDIIAPDTHP